MTTNSTENLTFSDALVAIKAGQRVQRSGWNGKGLCAFLKPGLFHGPYLGFKPDDAIPAEHPTTIEGVSVSLFEPTAPEDTAMRLPHVCLAYPTGTFVAWAPSQTDMLASDWKIIDEDLAYYPETDWDKQPALLVKHEPVTIEVRRGCVRVDRHAIGIIAKLQPFVVARGKSPSFNSVELIIEHHALDLVEENELIPLYVARYDDMDDCIKFHRVAEQ